MNMSVLALGMVLLSAVLHAIWNVAAKRNDQPATFLYLLTICTLGLSAVLLPWIPLQAFHGRLLGLLLLSCAFHGASFVALARAYESGDLSLVYPISRSTPAVVPLIAIPLCGERISLIGAGGILLSLAGMWLMQANGSSWRWLRARPALWAYVLLLIITGYSLTDKIAMALLSEASWPSPLPRALVYYLLQTSGAALILTPLTLRRVGAQGILKAMHADPALLIGATLATLASYVLVLEALRTMSVSYVVSLRQSSVLFAMLLAMRTLGERPSRSRLTGALGTVMGVILIALFA
jgi:drug/metabolite transporter (DMT)-like permease